MSKFIGKIGIKNLLNPKKNTNKHTQKKITKEYLKNKVKASFIVLWILIGFIGGTTAGNIIFKNRNEEIIQVTFIYSSENFFHECVG